MCRHVSLSHDDTMHLPAAPAPRSPCQSLSPPSHTGRNHICQLNSSDASDIIFPLKSLLQADGYPRLCRTENHQVIPSSQLFLQQRKTVARLQQSKGDMLYQQSQRFPSREVHLLADAPGRCTFPHLPAADGNDATLSPVSGFCHQPSRLQVPVASVLISTDGTVSERSPAPSAASVLQPLLCSP